MGPDDPIVWLAGCDWWYHTRRSEVHYARRLARHRRVVFVNSVTMGIGRAGRRALAAKVRRKLGSLLRLHRRVAANLSVFTPLALPAFGDGWVGGLSRWLLRRQLGLVRRMLRRGRPAVVVANPLFAGVLDALRPQTVTYFVTDKLDADPATATAAVARADRRMADRADCIVCVSDMLCRAYDAYAEKVAYLPHGVDFGHAARASRPGPIPEDLAVIPKPVAGYVGSTEAVAFDADLFVAVAEARPDWSFVLVGPVDEPSRFQGRPNIHLLGKQPYERVPDYLRGFAVCLLPLRGTEWVRHCNPIKLQEYLAAGKPVVSTDVPAVRRFEPHVTIAADPAQFAAALDRARADDTTDRRIARIDRVRHETWDRRVEDLEAILRGLRPDERETPCAASAVS